jgi:hypothetical protein
MIVSSKQVYFYMKINIRQHCPFVAPNDNQVFALVITPSDAEPQRALQGHLALQQ